nr:MAG TPA: hypothetical protein [Caudoviricetes sp.]
MISSGSATFGKTASAIEEALSEVGEKSSCVIEVSLILKL